MDKKSVCIYFFYVFHVFQFLFVQVELKFPAPSKTGNYQYSVILRSDSYMGLDQIKPLKVSFFVSFLASGTLKRVSKTSEGIMQTVCVYAVLSWRCMKRRPCWTTIHSGTSQRLRRRRRTRRTATVSKSRKKTMKTMTNPASPI